MRDENGDSARRARFRAVAVARGFACAGGERGLWCAGEGDVWARQGLPRGVAVHALLADPTGRQRIFVATDVGVLSVAPGGGRSVRAHVRGAQLLARVGERIAVAGAGGLFLLDAEGGAPQAVALEGARRRPGPGTDPQIRALGGHPGDLYVATRRRLWRLEREHLVPVPSPRGGALTFLAVCEKRLLAGSRSGLWLLAPTGWRSLHAEDTVHAVACAERRLVVATQSGLLVEEAAAPPTHLRDSGRSLRSLAEAAFALHGLDAPGLSARARYADWLPRLSFVARRVFANDVRGLRSDLLWPSLAGVPPRWNFDPVLRVRSVDRADFLLLAQWPLGEVHKARGLSEARLAERRHSRVRRRLFYRIAALVHAWRRAPKAEGRTLWRAVRRRLRLAEMAALLDGLTGAHQGGGGRS
jgi:hypothetical protein